MLTISFNSTQMKSVQTPGILVNMSQLVAPIFTSATGEPAAAFMKLATSKENTSVPAKMSTLQVFGNGGVARHTCEWRPAQAHTLTYTIEVLAFGEDPKVKQEEPVIVLDDDGAMDVN
jgi:hypothetical protein